MPCVAPRAGHGFYSPLPLNLPLESNYLAPSSPVSVLTAVCCTQALLSEVRDGKAAFKSSPIPTTRWKETWCMQYAERSLLGMPRRSKPMWKKRLRWKLKKGKVSVPSRQVLLLFPAEQQDLPPSSGAAIVEDRAHTHTDFNWDQFSKCHLPQSPSIDWKRNEALLRGSRFFCRLPHPLPRVMIIWTLGDCVLKQRALISILS